MRVLTPDDAGLQIDPGAGNMRAHGREHPHKTGARIGGATNDLHLFGFAARPLGPGFYPAQPQAVGVGMLNGLDDAGDAETAQRRRRVHDLFDLQAKISQRLDDLVKGRFGFKVFLEPGEGEFHRQTYFCIAGLAPC